jgi:hypothetical protein
MGKAAAAERENDFLRGSAGVMAMACQTSGSARNTGNPNGDGA